MPKTLAKERLLPSLLDRLTDDDPIHSAISSHRENIRKIERELAALGEKGKAAAPESTNRQRQALQKQLEQERAQQLFLSASTSSLKEIRHCVRRDLDWLLNAHNYTPQEKLDDYPQIAKSVLNYGLPDLAGKSVSGIDIRQLERTLKQVILDFEPRILPQTLDVRLSADKTLVHSNALTFEIEGELWAVPLPIHLHLLTELQLEDGSVSITEFHA